MAASRDQHVVTALQDAAHRTVGPEQKTRNCKYFNSNGPQTQVFPGTSLLAVLETHFQAATDVIPASIVVFMIFPPKAPPTRFT